MLGLLEENLRGVEFNRYNLEVYISIAQLYRQNLEMLLGVGRMCSLVESAQRAAAEGKVKGALESLDGALEIAQSIRQQRNVVLRDAMSTWYKSWLPRVEEANGRRFLHQLDDVKDHVPDRTVDMTYLVYRELQLPFGEWVSALRASRNQYAAARHLPEKKGEFDWRDTESVRVTLPVGPTEKRISRRDLILYGLVILTPTAPYSVYGIVQQTSHGYAALSYLVAMVAREVYRG